MEHNVKNFALWLSYITFAFKPIVFLVIWKVSYNFLTDIKQIPEAPRHIRLLKIKAQFGTKEETAVPGGQNSGAFSN